MPKNYRLALAGLWLTASFLANCSSEPPRLAIAPPTPVASPSAPSLPGGAYRVDTGQSEIRVLVYRAGPLAHLGHNHVIVNREIAGTAQIASAVAGQAGAASFKLSIPAAGFVVDDAQARSEEGPEFSAEVPGDARSDTLHNMLSAELLDAARFASITLESISVAADRDAFTSNVSVTVAGHRSTLVVPFRLVSTGSRVEATGTVTLRQTAIGLTPFRVMLGALTVQDEFTIKFKVVAVAG